MKHDQLCATSENANSILVLEFGYMNSDYPKTDTKTVIY